MPKQQFLAILSGDWQMAQSWMKVLAHTVQDARLSAEIRSLPKLAARLDAWIEAGNRLPEKGRWQDVAAELGVTREALYREFAKRRL